VYAIIVLTLTAGKSTLLPSENRHDRLCLCELWPETARRGRPGRQERQVPEVWAVCSHPGRNGDGRRTSADGTARIPHRTPGGRNPATPPGRQRADARAFGDRLPGNRGR